MSLRIPSLSPVFQLCHNRTRWILLSDKVSANGSLSEIFRNRQDIVKSGMRTYTAQLNYCS